MLTKWRRLHDWDSPTEAPPVKTLLREARKSKSRQGVAVRKKTAVALEPLLRCSRPARMVRGIRDRALLLLPGTVAVNDVLK
ncbi:putative phage-related integrase/recombinase [Pseudomonas amygdali pv. mellea]|nr:putative phage-related integrase/recombinase [Pseudomonas amygdali]KPX85348.1 putative phage-related integrase/recombinase [Pseudomonas amygdali pv. mellea]